MSTPLITISPNNTIKDAMETMLLKNFRRLVVIEVQNSADDGAEDSSSQSKTNRLVGIVTDRDIFKAIINNQNLMRDPQ